MSQLAARLGVSKNTISLALRHDPRVSAPTRQRVQRLAEQLGYAKNPVVAQLMAELRKTQPAGYQRTFALSARTTPCRRTSRAAGGAPR
jgi:LacI family transcriptional regulator